MKVTTAVELEVSDSRVVWAAFERLYPSVAAVNSPSDFAKKLVAAYIIVFGEGSCTHQQLRE